MGNGVAANPAACVLVFAIAQMRKFVLLILLLGIAAVVVLFALDVLFDVDL